MNTKSTISRLPACLAGGLSIILCCMATLALAQNSGTTTFKGVLKSKLTSDVVPYASIVIRGTARGVAANDQGRFEFPIHNENLGDTIDISAVGFRRFSAPVKTLISSNDQTILLKDTVYTLHTVVVSSLTPQEIVQKALDKFDTNFPSSPYEMDVLYRTTLKESNSYVKLFECTFRAYDRGFNYAKINDAVDISYKGIRKSNIYTNPKTKLPAPFFKPQWIMTMENYSRNKAAFVENMKNDVYDFVMDTSAILDDKLIYIVDANVKESVPKFIFSTRFFIRADDYAIVQMDFDGKKKVELIQPSGIPGPLRLKILKYTATYVFKEIDKKMYSHYLNDYATYEWYDRKTGELINSNEENSQAIIQNISFPPGGKSTLVRPANRKLAAIPYIPYNADQWKMDEMVRQIPYDPAIFKDLEARGGSIEQQFIENGKK